MAEVVLENVTKQFPDGTTAVNELNLDIQDGEFCVLVGPSGSGKSTALRMIAGLEGISSGTIRIGERIVNDVAPRDRDIAMVFQNYALYPHMSVFDNMSFALTLRKISKDEIAKRVNRAADILGINDLLERKPRQLSGGQRQRVAMGRAIVREPVAFLMDEPLSNLDAKLRVQMRTEIASLHDRLGTTTVYVTHDQIEAVTMADRVAVLNWGVLQQFGSPEDLYERPANIFVAGFIGSPAMNMVRSQVRFKGERVSLKFGEHEIEFPAAGDRAFAKSKDKEVILGIRPEDIEDPQFLPEKPKATIPARIKIVEPLGAETIAYFEVDAPPAVTKETLDLASDQEAMMAAERGEVRTSIFTGRLNPRTRLRPGNTVDLSIDPKRLYLFDPQSGRAIR